MISVLLADDSEVLRQGLRLVIEAEPGMRVLAEVRNGVDAVETARRLQPDVVLMDVRMPGGDGITATRDLMMLSRPPAVLVLTSFDRDEYIDQALRAGAAGFLLKDTTPQELVRAVRLVHEGGGIVDPSLVRRTVAVLTATPAPRLAEEERARLATLSAREREVVVLLAMGLSNASIGSELHTSESTVKGHVSRLMAKLGAENRVQVARLAYRAGLEPGI
ncbi:response regulator transcription factor [Streptomyces sp. NPDC004126]|uniref:response regulator transcription factor n=1 Tax=Streptomyces sp. NPDC004126 TaxID=3390695 RepID=UPI003D07E585